MDKVVDRERYVAAFAALDYDLTFKADGFMASHRGSHAAIHCAMGCEAEELDEALAMAAAGPPKEFL